MKKIVLILLLAPFLSYSQNLTGTWVGSSGMSYVKLVVVQQGEQVFGYTYDESPGFCKATFSGIYKANDGNLKGKGIRMLQNSGTHGLASYDLYYRLDGETEYLRGSVASRNLLARFLSMGISSPITLKKFSNKIDTIPFIKEMLEKSAKPPVVVENKTAQLAKPPVDTVVKKEIPVVTLLPVVPAIELKKQRQSKLVQNIYTDADTVKILVYDNGEVDNDTVTIFLDNAVVLDRYRISDKPKELYLPVNKDGMPHNVELFANNLGTIPPNTALIIIIAGRKRYELHASYDLETNAQITIQYRK